MVRQAVATVDVPVNSVSYIDDTVLLGSPDDVASVLQELPTLLEPTGLRLQPSKTKIWSPTPGVVASHPQLKGLQTTMSDIRGLTILGEAVGLEPEDAYPVGEEAYITDHLQQVSDRLCRDVCFATCQACVATSRQVYRWRGHCFRGRCRPGSSTSSGHILYMSQA